MTRLPLVPLQPLLALTLSRIGRLHSEPYGGLGEHAEKSFGIEPSFLSPAVGPFVHVYNEAAADRMPALDQ